MSDPEWLLKQRFETIEKLSNGFSLFALKTNSIALTLYFKECVKSYMCIENKELVFYYTNLCPFSEYHVQNSLLLLPKAKGFH